VFIVIPIGFVAFSFASKAVGNPVLITAGIVWAFVFCPAYLVYLCYIAPYFSSRSSYRKSSSLKYPIRYSLSDDVISQESAVGRAEVLWTAFVRARETRDLFLLYINKNLAHVIPKRAFSGENELAEFRGLLRRHLKNVSLRS